ncbi:hypothetical protein [Streptomyces sp. NPDC005096]|uniref:hypothetical protein n=1 Tax=Streptomyces sp. NPDC005096 TaxID=3154559 RepID=UPI0033A0DD75
MERDLDGYTATFGGKPVRRTVWAPDDIEMNNGKWARGGGCQCPCRIAHQYSYGEEEDECDSSGFLVARAIVERRGNSFNQLHLCGPCTARLLNARHGAARRSEAVWRASMTFVPGLAVAVVLGGITLGLPVPWFAGVAGGLMAAWAVVQLRHSHATKHLQPF